MTRLAPWPSTSRAPRSSRRRRARASPWRAWWRSSPTTSPRASGAPLWRRSRPCAPDSAGAGRALGGRALGGRRLGRRLPRRRRAQLDELLGDRVERELQRGQALVEAVDAVLDALQALGDRAHAPRETLDVGRRRDVQRPEGDLLSRGGRLARLEGTRDGAVDQGVLEQILRQSPEGVLALSGEALAQAVAAGFLFHAAERYRFRPSLQDAASDARR